jgi:TPR repeat protein
MPTYYFLLLPVILRAFSLPFSAAEKNNDKAQFELGNAYLTGNGVEATRT